MSRRTHERAGVNRDSRTVWRRLVGAVGVMLMLCGITAGPAGGAITLPVLWTAGGLDAGTTGAGQAGRMASDAAGNVAVVSGPAGGRDLAVTSYTADRISPLASHGQPGLGDVPGGLGGGSAQRRFRGGRSQRRLSSGNPIGITMVRYASDGTLLWRVDLPAPVPWWRGYWSMRGATPTWRSARWATARTSRCTSTAPPASCSGRR